LDCALDLMRRLPPQEIEDNLTDLIDLVPALEEDLLASVDQPLKIQKDESGKGYLLCDYNRDADSYRSPWTNTYYPSLEDGAYPSDRLRELEVEANRAFDIYREMYFEGGVSSVYLWDIDPDHGFKHGNAFAGVILIKKEGKSGSDKFNGCWDSIHVIEIVENAAACKAKYKLTSTVMLWLQTNNEASGMMNLGGSLTMQTQRDSSITNSRSHLVNMGEMIEDMENKMRHRLNNVYFEKTRDIVNSLRSTDSLLPEDKAKQTNLQAELFKNLKARSQQN